MALGPERLFFTALAARDLRLGKPVTFHGTPHDELLFTWGDVPVNVLVSRYTHLPSAVETLQEGKDLFWQVWGDVSSRVVWGNWGHCARRDSATDPLGHSSRMAFSKRTNRCRTTR